MSRSDDAIARLFAEANPMQGHPARRPSTPDITDISRRATDVTDLDIDPAPRMRSMRHGFKWAAAAALVVAVVAVLAVNIRPPSDAAATTTTVTTTAPIEIPVDDAEALADAFLAAVSAHDAEATQRFLDPAVTELVGQPVEDWDLWLSWMAATDLTFEVTTCAEVAGSEVTCGVEWTDRLARAAGLTLQPGEYRVRLQDGLVTGLEQSLDLSLYSPAAFEEFFFWLAETYGDSTLDMWSISSTGQAGWCGATVCPVMSTESIELFRSRLDVYTASDTPPQSTIRRYMAARAAGDADAAAALIDPTAELDDVWISSPSDIAGLFAHFEAMGWQWETLDCDNHYLLGPVELTCRYRLQIDLPAVEARNLGMGSIAFRAADDRLTRVATGIDLRNVELALEPWLTWLQENHPNESTEMYDIIDGLHVPRLDDTALALFQRLADEYRAANG